MDHKNTHRDSTDDAKRLQPCELLEDRWFFGNLLHRKSRMLRSFSDASTSSTNSQDVNSPERSMEETYQSIKQLPCCHWKMDGQKSDSRRSKRSSRNRKSSMGFHRATSLPSSLESEEFQDDEEVEFSMGKLIRQASMNRSDTLPPRTHSTKGLTPSPSNARQRSRRKPETQCIKMESSEETTRPQCPMNQLRTQRCLTDQQYEDLQGFKNLCFDSDEKELSPKIVTTVPHVDEGKSAGAETPCLLEAWGGGRRHSAPPVLQWDGKRPTEDVKAQIRFWARAVASNVRQEC